jgi:predicted O-linked N-acetylglucosamine transferase (SPINDLY family)
MKKVKTLQKEIQFKKSSIKTFGLTNNDQKKDTNTQMTNAILLHQTGQLAEAEIIYNQVLSINPEHPKALSLLGAIAVASGNIEVGVNLISRSIAHEPEDFDAHANLGSALIYLERHNEALKHLDQALTLNSESHTAYSNRGICLRHLGRTDEAIKSFLMATSLKPEFGTAHHNLSYALLSSGHEQQGLAAMEWRWKDPMFDFKMRDFSEPMWDGIASLNNKTLRLWPEQGPGDMIIWASRLKEVILQTERCVVQIYPKLASLFARSFPEAMFEDDGGERDIGHKNEKTRDFDFHLPMGSLFFRLQQTPSLPVNTYLTPDPERVAFWKKRLSDLGQGPYIGISWTSGITSPGRMHNYTRIDDWGPVFQKPAQFINIQFGDCQNDLSQAHETYGIKIHTFEDLDIFNDLDDLAALAKALDLVISVSTIAAPLAASVGTPTWLIAWKQSPWNNFVLSARGPEISCFERNTGESWDAVFEAMAKRLQSTFNLPIKNTDTRPVIKSQCLDLRLDKAVKKFNTGYLVEAEKICRCILEADPSHPHALCLLGNIAYSTGQTEEAIALIKKAIALRPNFIKAHVNLGVVLRANGQIEEALRSINLALSLDPNLIEAINIKGIILDSQGNLDEAITCYQKCLKIEPNQAEAYINLGNTYMKRGQLERAIENYREAININPNHDIALGNMGLALQGMGYFIEAVESFIKAVAANPNNADNHNGLGTLMQDMGELNKATDCFQQAVKLAPHHSFAARNYLHALSYIPEIDNSKLFNEYCRMIRPGSTVKKNDSKGFFVDYNSPKINMGHMEPGKRKRLRIGYVSSDFHNHPLANNVLPLITNHDLKAFEIFCYANLKKSDEITKKIQHHSSHWRTINELSDEEVAKKVQDDKIHILILLGGNFDKNRPNISVHRAAPIQVSMYGGTTTALDAMDYWMTDALLHPPDADPNTAEKFTETLCRLPNLYVYPYPENTPAVSTLPADKNDFITFASFNKPCKMNDEVLDLWSQVLLKIPRSQLLLKSKDFFASPFTKQKLETRFENNGIDPKRINMLSSIDNMHDHLANYHQADIALDTFPFAGATTTFQALWMGVPVISLMGNRFLSRAGGVISLQAGLEGTIAKDKNEFIEKAVALASDRPKLRRIRETLRQKISASPLCNGPAYTRNVEIAFQSMWVNYLKRK